MSKNLTKLCDELLQNFGIDLDFNHSYRRMVYKLFLRVQADCLEECISKIKADADEFRFENSSGMDFETGSFECPDWVNNRWDDYNSCADRLETYRIKLLKETLE